jgi:hypothetical protein
VSAKRAAAVAFSLIFDLADRLDAAGVPADRAPSLDEALSLVWPLARQLARLEKTAALAGDTAARAREAVLATVVASVAAAAAPQVPAPGDVARQPGAGTRRWAEFDPDGWHVELVPGPASDRDRAREVA